MKRGFSLLEMVVACGIFALAMLCLFAIMQFGFRAFALGNQRMGVQAEQEAILTFLRNDLEATTASSLSISSSGARNIVVPLSTGAVNQSRHILCCCGLSNWNDKKKFNILSGLPEWDLYLIYQADLAPQGSLYRLEMGPTAADEEGWNRFSVYVSNFPHQPPNMGNWVNGVVVRRYKRLTQNLLGFEITQNNNDVIVRLLLYNRSTYQGPLSDRQRSQVLETNTRIKIRNRAH